MKLIKFFLLVLFTSTFAHAYTLNTNFSAAFDKNHVNVRIAGNTLCSGAGITVYELQDLINPSVDDFWNRVPTSALRLKEGGFTEPITNINLGRLCSPTDDACVAAAGVNLIPEVNEIVIACNNNPDNFNGANVLAVTIPNHFKGKNIKGSIILINDSSSAFSNLSRSDKIGVLAHEIGHAIGLGHAEEGSALMFYRTVALRRTLGQDDIDGVSYLYPVKFPGDGCGLFGGTIDTDKIDPGLWQVGIGFLLLLMLARMRRYFITLKLVPRRAHSAS